MELQQEELSEVSPGMLAVSTRAWTKDEKHARRPGTRLEQTKTNWQVNRVLQMNRKYKLDSMKMNECVLSFWK